MAIAWKYNNNNDNSAYRYCCCHVRTGTLILGLITLLLQGVVMSTFIVAISRPQLLGTVMPTDMMGISTTTQSADSVHSHTNNPLLYYVMTTDREPLVIATLMTAFLMAITACLICGTIRSDHRLLIPFMTIQIFDACITGLAMVSHGASAAGLRHWIKTQHFFICKEMLLKMDDAHLMLCATIVFVASMSIQIYAISLVFACYNYLKERMRLTQYGYRVDACNGDTEMLLPPKYEDVISMPASANSGDSPPSYTPE